MLTAFLVLAIVPLSLISWYATQRERAEIQREVTAKLASVATMMERQVRQGVDNRKGALALLAALPATQECAEILRCAQDDSSAAARTAQGVLRGQLRTLLTQDPAWGYLAVLDGTGQQVLVCTGTRTEDGLWLTQPITDAGQASEAGETRGVRSTVGMLVGTLKPGDLVLALEAVAEGPAGGYTEGGLGESGEIYLVDRHGMRWVVLSSRVSTPGAVGGYRKVTSAGIEAALGGLEREGLEENYAGVPVIGVYRWIPELELALVAEQAQEEAFATTDRVTAAMVGATLGVALLTAVMAAVVTQQITRPIVRLTESALRIADGKLEQRVPVTSRDEIGILAYVFNRMAGELKTLYDDLEGKVAERTALLQEANYQVQRRAMQLATTVEVSQAASSILEPEQLVREAVALIRERFGYAYVGMYVLEEGGGWAVLQEGVGGSERLAAAKGRPVRMGAGAGAEEGGGTADEEIHDREGGAVRQAALTGKPSMVRVGGGDEEERAEVVFGSRYIRAEAALPLKLGEEGEGRRRVMGVLDILSTEGEDFDADDVAVLQAMANQLTIALENARAYAVEREAAKRLREMEQAKRRFLGHMSHELRTPLTNIIGFSRLMLKGMDGPLGEQQAQDVEIIYHNGQHLMGLINDLLDVSQIEAGLMELEFREVRLGELIRSVMATASALVRDKDIELRQEVAPDLPMVQADEVRIREVLLRLLAKAAQVTEEGAITVRSWAADDAAGTPVVYVSVSDTGTGRPPEEEEEGTLKQGVALSKEFVELHGGRMWVECTAHKGSTTTFTLPLKREM